MFNGSKLRANFSGDNCFTNDGTSLGSSCLRSKIHEAYSGGGGLGPAWDQCEAGQVVRHEQETGPHCLCSRPFSGFNMFASQSMISCEMVAGLVQTERVAKRASVLPSAPRMLTASTARLSLMERIDRLLDVTLQPPRRKAVTAAGLATQVDESGSSSNTEAEGEVAAPVRRRTLESRSKQRLQAYLHGLMEGSIPGLNLSFLEKRAARLASTRSAHENEVDAFLQDSKLSRMDLKRKLVIDIPLVKYFETSFSAGWMWSFADPNFLETFRTRARRLGVPKAAPFQCRHSMVTFDRVF